MQVQPDRHIAEVIEEAIYRRVEKTIQQYADKNQRAFQANRIAGIQWKLDLNVLVDNLGLLPVKPQTPFSRFIDFFRRLCRKAANNPAQDAPKAP